MYPQKCKDIRFKVFVEDKPLVLEFVLDKWVEEHPEVIIEDIQYQVSCKTYPHSPGDLYYSCLIMYRIGA